MLRKDRMAVDIAMFGRMLANKPEFNVEAACQSRMHLVSVKRLSKMIFSPPLMICARLLKMPVPGILVKPDSLALFYTYICIDKDLLVENLGGDEALANQTLRAFTEAALKVSPTGKQNSFASRAYASGRWQKKALNNHALWRRLSMNPLMAPGS